MDTQHTEQALFDLGYVPAYTGTTGHTYGGFKVTEEENGDSKIVYVLSTGTDRLAIEARRSTVRSHMRNMERDLSRKGWKVTSFEPDTDLEFWLKVKAEDAEYQLPGETEEAYLNRKETESDRAAWSRQDG